MSWEDKAQVTYERAQQPAGDKPHNNHVIGNIVWAVIWIVTKVCFRVSGTGMQNIRQFDKSGALVICNHVSYTDPVFHYVVLRTKQWPRFMAKEDIMHGFPGWFLGMHGAFPVTRDSADLSAIKRAVKYLKDGEVVALFPEGTRRGKGNVALRIHAGVALIARMGKVPVVPSTVHNADRVKRKGERLRFPKITVEYGNPVLVSDFNFLPKEDRLDACVWYALRECFALVQHVSPDDVDMVSLFPEDKDFTAAFAEHPIARLTSAQVAELLES